jgi:hypothetical protein
MTKQIELRPDRTAVIDGKLRGVFREIVSGKLTAVQSNRDVRRMSNERSAIITSRNTPDRPKK